MNINNFLTFDEPVPYRNIKLYPIKVKDYTMFGIHSICLNLDKNSIPDPKIIKMTELEYIYTYSNKDYSIPYVYFLDRLLGMCIKDDQSFEKTEESIKRYKFDERGKPFFLIGDEAYKDKDFQEIKKIIATQNMVDLIDETIAKNVRDSLDRAKEYRRKILGEKSASLEDYIVSLASVTGWTFEYIYEMPIRKFIKTIRRTDNYIHYKIYLSASMSGMVEFKNKSFIKHWLTNIDDDSNKYDDVSVDLDKIKKTISFEGADKK